MKFTVWVKSLSDGADPAFEVKIDKGSDVADLKKAITNKRDSLHLPVCAID